MSLKKYEAFVKTVELGSLTKAAEALDSTQSRISHIIRDLEEEYGFTLMRRSRGGVELTEFGSLALPKMKAVLAQDQVLKEFIADIRSADAGTVRLGAFTSVAVHWLPGMIRAFQQAHPKAELEMLNGDYHDMEQWLREGSVDLGFVTLPAPPNVRTIPLAEDPLVASSVCCARPIMIFTGPWTGPASDPTSNIPPRMTMPSLPWWSRDWESPSSPSC